MADPMPSPEQMPPLPCPFCGKEKPTILRQDRAPKGSMLILCTGCSASIGGHTMFSAVERWNTREASLSVPPGEDAVAWLIEVGSPANYLTLYGTNPEDESLVEGRAGWSTIEQAIRFTRRRDAVMVLGIIRSLYAKLPYHEGVPGLRLNDLVPRICDHQWVRAAAHSSSSVPCEKTNNG